MSRGKNKDNKKRQLKSTIKELKQLFKKLSYPTDKQELINHAQMGGDGDASVYIVDSLQQEQFEHFSDVADALDAFYEEKIEELTT